MTQYSSSSANTEGHVVVKERASAARLNPGGVSEGSTAVRTTASWAAGERRRGGAGKLACVVRQRTARDQECRQSWGDATQGWMWICSGPSVTNWSHLVLQGCRSGGGGHAESTKGHGARRHHWRVTLGDWTPPTLVVDRVCRVGKHCNILGIYLKVLWVLAEIEAWSIPCLPLPFASFVYPYPEFTSQNPRPPRPQYNPLLQNDFHNPSRRAAVHSPSGSHALQVTWCTYLTPDNTPASILTLLLSRLSLARSRALCLCRKPTRRSPGWLRGAQRCHGRPRAELRPAATHARVTFALQ